MSVLEIITVCIWISAAVLAGLATLAFSQYLRQPEREHGLGQVAPVRSRGEIEAAIGGDA